MKNQNGKGLIFDKVMANMVKGIAVILMLMHHLFGCATQFCEKYGVTTSFFSWNALYSFSISAKICVGMFVFVTAFGITRQYNKCLEASGNSVLLKDEVVKFSIKRYVKLEANFLFIYVAAVLTSSLRIPGGGIWGVYNINGVEKGIMYAVFDSLGLAHYFGTPSLNETWWYMSIAILIIFFVPIVIRLYKENGLLIFVIAAFIFYFGVTKTTFVQYLFCIVLGIWFAEEDIIEKLSNKAFIKNETINIMLKIVIDILIIIILFFTRGKTGYSYWLDGIFAVVFSCICMNVYKMGVVFGKRLGKGLEFIGKHSMNIFLIHTLIFEYYFTKFIYSFKHWSLILIALLVSSLICSMVVEWLKAKINYHAKIEYLYSCIRSDNI